MSDPRQAAAHTAAIRVPRWARALGWAIAVLLWAIASDAHPVLALLSALAAVVIRGVYVIATSWGKGRFVFWSPWFFAVAALCEVVWRAAR